MPEYYRLNLLQIPARHGGRARPATAAGRWLPHRLGKARMRSLEFYHHPPSLRKEGRRQTCILHAAAVIPAGPDCAAAASAHRSALTARRHSNPPLKQSVGISERPLLEWSPPLPFLLRGSYDGQETEASVDSVSRRPGNGEGRRSRNLTGLPELMDDPFSHHLTGAQPNG